jgi:hypothetical protein
VSPPREAAVRRFALFWSVSTLWKVAALAGFLVLAVKLSGGTVP